MMKVYSKISGELAMWEVDTDDHVVAIKEVRDNLPFIFDCAPVLALIEPKPFVLDFNLPELA